MKTLEDWYEMLRKFETSRDDVEIRLTGEHEGVVIDNTLASMAKYLAREWIKRNIALVESRMMQELECEDVSV